MSKLNISEIDCLLTGSKHFNSLPIQLKTTNAFQNLRCSSLANLLSGLSCRKKPYFHVISCTGSDECTIESCDLKNDVQCDIRDRIYKMSSEFDRGILKTATNNDELPDDFFRYWQIHPFPPSDSAMFDTFFRFISILLGHVISDDENVNDVIFVMIEQSLINVHCILLYWLFLKLSCQSIGSEKLANLVRHKFRFHKLIVGNVIVDGDNDLNQLLEIRSNQIDFCMQQRHNVESPNAEICQNLAQLVMQYELLSKKSSNVLRVQIDEPIDQINSATSDAVFIMYNFARVCSVLTRFELEFDLLNVDFTVEMDTSVLDEASKLLNCIQVNLIDILNGQDPQNILKFSQNFFRWLTELTHNFSSYYRNVKVLRGTGQHLQSKMVQRILIYRFIRNLYKRLFELIHVKPILHM